MLPNFNNGPAVHWEKKGSQTLPVVLFLLSTDARIHQWIIEVDQANCKDTENTGKCSRPYQAATPYD